MASDNEKRVKERIGNDLKGHTVKVLHADGLYRHWRCGKPNSSEMSFHVVTWPGSLCYTGDMGDFLFQRCDDMISWMRGACRSYGYAAEKCEAHGSPIREWSEDVFERELADRLNELTDDLHDPEDAAEISEHTDAIEEIRAAYELDKNPDDAYREMADSGLFDEIPKCEQFSLRFLWCLHALDWFIKQIDQPRTDHISTSPDEVSP